LKTNRKHIALAWILLFCFAAGQWVVGSHQHSFPKELTAKHSQQDQHRSVVSENCQLCDAMHHQTMVISTPVYFAPVTISKYHYKDARYEFTSIALILSAGRSPPMA
jgi:hypothetical protein